jgi:hypothetical protein
MAHGMTTSHHSPAPISAKMASQTPTTSITSVMRIRTTGPNDTSDLAHGFRGAAGGLGTGAAVREPTGTNGAGAWFAPASGAAGLLAKNPWSGRSAGSPAAGRNELTGEASAGRGRGLSVRAPETMHA